MKLFERHKKEMVFHDERYGRAQRIPKIERWLYSLVPSLGKVGSREAYDNILLAPLGDVKMKTVLEVGCGSGELAVQLAASGAYVYAFDISRQAVKEAKTLAEEMNLQHRVNIMQMACESLALADNSFDIVIGMAILHHTDLSSTAKEISRVLKPNGRGIFFEPLGHNPLANLWRRLTPHCHTSEERPLLFRDIKKMGEYFSFTTHQELRLLTLFTSLFKVFLRDQRVIDKIQRVLGALDKKLLVIKPLRRFCGSTLIQVLK